MASPPLIIAGAVFIALCALAWLAAPLLTADMRHALDRDAANDNAPDLTAVAIIVLGAALIAGIPGVLVAILMGAS